MYKDKKQEIRKRLMKLPIRTVLTILLFPFFILLVLCCVSFYGSGVNHYTSMVKENAESLVVQSRNYLNEDMSNIQEMAEGLLDERGFYEMEQNIKKDEDPIEPIEYLQLSNGFTTFLQHYSPYIESMGMWISDNSIYYYQSNTGNTVSIMRDIDYRRFLGEQGFRWIGMSEILPEYLSGQLPHHFAMIHTMGSQDSKLNGVFFIGIRDEMFFNQIQNSRPTPNSEIALIEKDGRIITGTAEADKGKKALSMLDEAQIEEICREISQAQDKEVRSFEIDRYYVIYTPVEMEDTGILAVIPNSELYISSQEFSHIFIFFAFAVIVIIVFCDPAVLFKTSKKSLKTDENNTRIVRRAAYRGKRLSGNQPDREWCQ